MIEIILIIILANGPAFNGMTVVDGFKSIRDCEGAANEIRYAVDYEIETMCVEIDKGEKKGD